ncbi:hypothetical protein ACHAXT_001275 [Thalassiosira profunda]
MAADPLPAIVFIHGWKASVLVDAKTGAEKFNYAFSHLLGFGGNVLELPMERDAGGGQLHDDLVASEPTRNIECLCGSVTLAELYGPLLDHLAHKRKRDVRAFAYDWRRELGETSQKLEAFLEDVKRETGRAAQLIGHSMGCLITLHVLNRRPDLFHSVLFGAGAMSPNLSLTEDYSIVGGPNAIAMSKNMFTPSQHLTNPGAFHMLIAYPGEREKYGKENIVLLYDALGKPAEFDLHSLGTWKRLGIGMYHPESGVEVTETKEEWLQSVLDRCLAFRKGLIPSRPESEYPPVAVLNSDGLPTNFAFHLDGNGKVDFSNVDTLPGDGRVMYEDSLPPDGVPVVRKITNKEEHTVVLNDIEAVDALIECLFEAARRESR